MIWKDEVARIELCMDGTNHNLINAVMEVVKKLRMKKELKNKWGMIYRVKMWFAGECHEANRSMEKSCKNVAKRILTA